MVYNIVVLNGILVHEVFLIPYRYLIAEKAFNFQISKQNVSNEM